MNNWPLDRAIMMVLVAAGIIALTLFLVGSWKNKRMVRGVGIALYIGFAVCLFIFWTDFREIITAFTAVAAVVIAAFSINESRRIRQDSMEREKRDRKERLVDEVAKWLRELEGRMFPKVSAMASGTEDTLRRISTSPKIPVTTWLQMDTVDRVLGEMQALAEGIREGEYYQKLTSQLSEELSSSIGLIVNNLKQRRELHVEDARYPLDLKDENTASKSVKELIENDDKPLEGSGLDDKAIVAVRLGRNAHAIRKAVVNAADKVIELKTSLIQSS
jgi:hypothetical protein